MKNMFKMMGVALLAGAMLFTACKKDEETTNTNNTTPTYAVTVTYNDATWQSNSNVLYFIDEDGLNLQASEGENWFAVICGTEAQNYSFGVGNYGVAIGSAEEEQINGTTNGYINISAIELNAAAKSISAKLRCEMETIESGKWLDITMNNATLVEGAK